MKMSTTPLVNCGAMKFSSSQTKAISVEPARMESIKMEHFEEEKAVITDKTFTLAKRKKHQ